MIIFTSSNCSRRAMARLYPRIVAFFFLIHEIMFYSQFTSIGKVKEALLILTGGSVSPSSPNPFFQPPFPLQDTAGELEKPNPPAPFPTPLVPPYPPRSPLQEGGGQRMFHFFCTGRTKDASLFLHGRGSIKAPPNKKYYSASLSL